ncbi:MAG TPA: helix-turn-helix transcriptional regulator [Pseudonocardiaceae bacterium]
MPDGAGPLMGRRRLAAELRRLRTVAGKTIYEVAEVMECSTGKISRIETGSVGARLQDVRELLDLYGVTGARRAELLDLVRQARQKPWWHEYAAVVPPNSAILYGLEAAATTVDEHQCGLVPGLLQTEAYAEALIGSPTMVTADQVKRRVELRMRRQELLTREDGPAYHTIIGEAALREPIGGPAVMAEQLRYLIQAAERPRTTIQVRPFGAGKPTAVGTSFMIFGFADPAYGKVAYLEQLTRNSYLDEADEVAFYASTFADIGEYALSPPDSRELLEKLVESFS